MNNTTPLSRFPLFSMVALLGLLAQTTLPAMGQNTAPTAVPTATTVPGAGPNANDSASINHALRSVIEKEDPSTQSIFDKYPNFILAAPPMPARAAAAGPAPQFNYPPRDLQPWTSSAFTSLKPNLPSLIIAGDSTAQTGDSEHRGWGAPLVDYFDTSKINLLNKAVGGRSYRTFVFEKMWDAIVAVIKPGDIVVIQFGHNDGGDIHATTNRPDLPGTGEETQTITRTSDGKEETVHTFGWYERKFIKDVQDKGGVPIIMTTTDYNRWNNGQFSRVESNVNKWAKQVAAEEKVTVLDHNNIIGDHLAQLGQDAVKPLFNMDGLHTTTPGAIVNAEMFVSGVKALNLQVLVDALNDKGKAIAAYQPVAPAATATP